MAHHNITGNLGEDMAAKYLLDKGYISTAEDFIARTATESSMSHKAYIVKCGSTETNSAQWFKDALINYRTEAAASPKTQ